VDLAQAIACAPRDAITMPDSNFELDFYWAEPGVNLE
jgi:hypothetical protein